MINLLLIDDDESEFRLIQRMLKDCYDHPFILHHAHTLVEAIEFLKSYKIDLILLDDKLGNGLTAKKTVPILRAVSDVMPLVVISSIINAEHLTDKSHLDVYDIIDKYSLRERIRGGLLNPLSA